MYNDNVRHASLITLLCLLYHHWIILYYSYANIIHSMLTDYNTVNTFGQLA